VASRGCLCWGGHFGFRWDVEYAGVLCDTLKSRQYCRARSQIRSSMSVDTEDPEQVTEACGDEDAVLRRGLFRGHAFRVAA